MATEPAIRPPPPKPSTRPAPPSASHNRPTAAPASNGSSALSFGRPKATTTIAPRVVLNCVEGWGKTTAGAHAEDPILLMASNETGYELLLQSGLVPEIDRATSATWLETMTTLDSLAASERGRKTLVLDALNGFERQAQEHVCTTCFSGDWGERGFAAYAKGYDMTAGEWVKFLCKLDAIRAKHGTTILLLSHCKIRPFKNPEGPDFDRYASNLHEKVWDLTKQWADLVGFGNFFTVVEDTDAKKKRGKAIGGDQRVLYAVRSAAYDAKNRFGMPAMLEIPDDHTQVWTTITNSMNRSTNVSE